MVSLHYSKAQVKDVAKLDELTREINNGWHLYNLMCKAGNKEDAENNIKPNINKKVLERQRLELQIHERCREGTSALLMTLCGCELMTDLADYFGYKMNDISKGDIKKKNAFSEQCKILAKEFNRVVCHIDGVNDAMSNFYADMAEEAVKAAKDAMQGVVDKYMNTEKGRQYF